MKLLKRVVRQAKLMEEGAAVLDELAKEPERAPKAVGALAGVATPVAVVVATGELTGLAGGAAIMKTLAVAGGVVGGGAIAGIGIVGIGAVAVAWGVTKAVKRVTPSFRSKGAATEASSDGVAAPPFGQTPDR